MAMMHTLHDSVPRRPVHVLLASSSVRLVIVGAACTTASDRIGCCRTSL